MHSRKAAMLPTSSCTLRPRINGIIRLPREVARSRWDRGEGRRPFGTIPTPPVIPSLAPSLTFEPRCEQGSRARAPAPRLGQSALRGARRHRDVGAHVSLAARWLDPADTEGT